MSQRSDGKAPSLEEVSALVDGELDDAAVARACATWRDDAQARESWHTWQLIGDVLRSDDLASAAPHDSAFMASFRARLAAEPVILAPSVEAAPVPVEVAAVANGAAPGSAARRAWRTPAAVAAGFAVVASVLVVTRVPTAEVPGTLPAGTVLAQGDARSPAAAPTLTRATPDAASQVPAFARQPAGSSDAQVVLDGRLIRDARIDEYLAAHKKFGGSSGPGGPSGSLRNAVAVEGR